MKPAISTKMMSSSGNQDLYIRQSVHANALIIEIIDNSMKADAHIVLTPEEVKTLISALEFMLDK